MDMEDSIIVVLSAIGFVSLCKRLLPIFKWVLKIVFRRPKNLDYYGSWAVVTGSTDGIGKALAFELASKGRNLVCVGRNPSKLESTEAEIRHKYGHNVQIRNVVVDFVNFSPSEIRSALEEGMEGIDVGLVVNNAGMAYPYARYLHEVDAELTESVIRVNVEAAIWVTRTVIPKMMKKRRGAIINIGSGCSVYAPAFPLFTLYMASKTFMEKFSKSISLEYEKYGIDIQCQVPLFVSTKMISVESNIVIPSADTYSKASVRWMGYDRVCCPYWGHMLLGELTSWLPDVIKIGFLKQLFLYHRRKMT